MATLNEMDEEAKKLAMLLWALKVHRGELRMFGGVWRRVLEFSPPLPDWAQPKPGALTPKQMDRYRALERRTHPSSFGADMVEPFHYTDQEVEAQRQEGTRPPLRSTLSIWWAHDTEVAPGEPHMGPEVPHPHLLDAVHLQVHLQLVVQPPSGHRSQAARQRCSGLSHEDPEPATL